MFLHHSAFINSIYLRQMKALIFDKNYLALPLFSGIRKLLNDSPKLTARKTDALIWPLFSHLRHTPYTLQWSLLCCRLKYGHKTPIPGDMKRLLRGLFLRGILNSVVLFPGSSASSGPSTRAQLLGRVWLFVTPWTVWPARLLCPWDFPGKNTGVCCHFLLQSVHTYTCCDSLGSSVHSVCAYNVAVTI